MDDMKKGWEKRLEESQHEMNVRLIEFFKFLAFFSSHC